MEINSYEALKYAVEDIDCDFVTGYAGTIASSFISRLGNVTQAINETVALDLAHIHSYLGKRSLVMVKNAGLNEAALPFRNICDTGINAGMIIIVTDDIEAKMSENRQDSRIYAVLGKTLLLEPSNPKELYEMITQGFLVSENIGMPVLVRLTNSLDDEKFREEVKRTDKKTNTLKRSRFDQTQWVLNPLHTQKVAKLHDERYTKIKDFVETVDFNHLIDRSGNGKCIYSQALSESERKIVEGYSKIFKIGTFPIPSGKLLDFSSGEEKIDIIDSGEGFLEDQVNLVTSKTTLGKTIKRDYGWKGLGISKNSKWIDYSNLFNLITDRKPDVVVGDFGSYTMAFDSPIEYALHYGGGIASAVGAYLSGEKKVYTIIGDGGFSCGTEGLIEASRKNADVNIVIIKNIGISKKEPINIDLKKLAMGNGAVYCKEIPANDLNVDTFMELESKTGPSVLIVDYSNNYMSPTEYILNRIKNKFSW